MHPRPGHSRAVLRIFRSSSVAPAGRGRGGAAALSPHAPDAPLRRPPSTGTRWPGAAAWPTAAGTRSSRRSTSPASTGTSRSRRRRVGHFDRHQVANHDGGPCRRPRRGPGRRWHRAVDFTGTSWPGSAASPTATDTRSSRGGMWASLDGHQLAGVRPVAEGRRAGDPRPALCRRGAPHR